MKVHQVHREFRNPRHPISVHVVGAGGTGSQVMSALGRIHTSLQSLGKPGIHVTLYDPDEITEANIGRQLFSLSDLGMNKATILVNRINRFFGTGWDSMPKLYESFPDYVMPNILITCVDTAKARIEIGIQLSIACDGSEPYHKGLYWIDFGNSQNTGQVVLGTLFDAGDNAMQTVVQMFDLSGIVEEDQGPSCSLAEALTKQDLFINSTLANLGCNLIWKLLTKENLDQQGLYLNLHTMSVRPILITN